jgi:hypothetical protein
MGFIEVEVCPDCLMFNANGWDEELYGRPLPAPEPMWLLKDFIMSSLQSEEGECEGHFSISPCDGCGERLAGQRFCAIAVHESDVWQ